MIIRDAKARQQEADTQQKDDNDDDGANPPTGGGSNSGTLIVDATCTPSNIRFPQDVSLLDEAREKAEP